MNNFKIPIPLLTNKLTDLSIYSSNSPSQLNSTMKYMSEYERQTSKVLENDWDYYINDYGYRDKWELSPNTKKIGCFGCSCTFGVGVESRHTFSKVLQKKYNSYNVEVLNLGQPGAGIQRVAKLVSASKKILNFDTVILTLPSSVRFLVLDDNHFMMDIVPGFVRHDLRHHEKYFYTYFGQKNLDMFFIDYVHWIKAELRDVKQVLWSTWCVETYKILEDMIEKDSLLPKFSFVDKGRDDHPGIKSHSSYAQKIIQKIGNTYG